MLRIINGEAVRSLYSIEDAVPAMERAMIAFSDGSAYQHPRITVEPPGADGERGMVLLMPAAAAGSLGLKLLSMFPRAAEKGLASVQGLIILVDAVHGEPLAVIDGVSVTEIRTAAVTALATARLARPDATALAFIGAGVQARGHLRALAGLRRWKSIRLFSRTRERAEDFVRWAAEEAVDGGTAVEIASSPTDALRGADVICTVTSACAPVLADTDVAERGVHVNAIGAFGPRCQELPPKLVARARIFVDSRPAALAEAGDLMVPLADGVITEDAIVAELGEVLAGAPGRLGDELTVFESLGLPIQDTVACDAIYRRAVEAGAGHEISFP